MKKPRLQPGDHAYITVNGSGWGKLTQTVPVKVVTSKMSPIGRRYYVTWIQTNRDLWRGTVTQETVTRWRAWWRIWR